MKNLSRVLFVLFIFTLSIFLAFAGCGGGGGGAKTVGELYPEPVSRAAAVMVTAAAAMTARQYPVREAGDSVPYSRACSECLYRKQALA